MSTVTFDTFRFVERLEKAGVPREQAAAIVEAQKESLAEAMDASLATRSDIAEAKSELKADIAKLEARMDTLELRLTVKLGAFIAAAVGILIAVLRMPQ